AVVVGGPVVFVWSSPSSTTSGDWFVATLRIWTAAAGTQIASFASATFEAAVSADGTRILFTDNANAAGTSADLLGASADLSTMQTLITGLTYPSNSATCFPNYGFAGGAAIVARCATGSTTAKVSAFDPFTAVETQLLAQATDTF